MFRVLKARAIAVVALVAAGVAAIPASAAQLTLECTPRFKGDTYMTDGRREQTLRWNFNVTGEYRIDTTARSVTINFTIDDHVAERYSRRSRFITDILAMDDTQIVFCEGPFAGCRREQDAGHPSYRHVLPTVIDLKTMTISSSETSYYTGKHGSRSYASTDSKVSGGCRRL